jgi:hypothetical protein
MPLIFKPMNFHLYCTKSMAFDKASGIPAAFLPPAVAKNGLRHRLDVLP